jgi:hypothetical protein
MLLVLGFTIASASDTWTNVRPGVDQLVRTQSGPNVIYAVKVDLTLPNVAIRATNGWENAQTTGSFAREVGALVAINGDWSDAVTPVGLAIGDGWLWHEHVDGWSYFACDIFKNCDVDESASTLFWSQGRLFNAVGANGARLVEHGAILHFSGSFYETDRHPRSAICLEPDGTTLWMVVVQGRVDWSIGMTWNETSDLMASLGCYDAVMLDGGGSSTLWVDGAPINTPTDGYERSVSNHFAIQYRTSTDAVCVGRENGRHCDGSVLQTCTGGAWSSTGDCAAWGLPCEEDGAWAYCVDSRCPHGSGQGGTCLDGLTLATCVDGAYAEGDCGWLGMTCEAYDTTAYCVDPRCAAGGMGSFCASGTVIATCTAGVYSEGDCAAYGATCGSDDAGAFCVDPRCEGDPERAACAGAVASWCDRGAYAEQDCAASGLECAAGSCVGVDDTSAPVDSETEDRDGPRPGPPDADETGVGGRVISGDDPKGCGCVSGRSGAGWPVAVGLLWLRRRRWFGSS